jgi:hypothetical protein
LRVAYEAHFALSQHYSSIIFKGRLGIVTLTVAAVSVSLGLTPERSVPAPAPLAPGIGALLPYISGWLVSLLHAMEVSYVKRFFQVVASGRNLEQSAGLKSYFSLYDRPEAWPLRTVYFFAVVVLVLVSARAAWSSTLLPRSPLLFTALGVLPLGPLVLSSARMERYFTGQLAGPTS